MLDRFDRHLVVRQAGRQLNAREVMHGRRHFEVAEIGPAKPNAEIGRRRLEREIDLVAGVKTNSDAGDMSAKRTL